SSTFFTRLKVGDKLVDARGVSSLFRGRAGLGPMFLFVFGGLGALVAAVAVSSDLQRFIELLAQRVQSLLGVWGRRRRRSCGFSGRPSGPSPPSRTISPTG